MELMEEWGDDVYGTFLVCFAVGEWSHWGLAHPGQGSWLLHGAVWCLAPKQCCAVPAVTNSPWLCLSLSHGTQAQHLPMVTLWPPFFLLLSAP